jgi:mannobiose 2-epimerase
VQVAERARYGAEIENSLWRDIIDCWFPRAIDPRGFHQNFSRDWSRMEGDERTTVYQSRVTWIAASLASFYPDRYERFKDIALHGLGYMTHALLDHDLGAFLWRVDERDNPCGNHATERHVYSNAFALYACSAVARHCSDKAALETARSVWNWFENCARDKERSGYFECTTEVGNPITQPPDEMWPYRDSLGTPYGQRAQNSHLHILEAFTEYFLATGDAQVGMRLNEMVEILLNKYFTPEGSLHVYLWHDWRPVLGATSFGHDVEAAHLIINAKKALGDGPSDDLLYKARRLVENTLLRGWEPGTGAIWNSGPFGDASSDRTRIWWAQVENLLALVTLDSYFGAETDRYAMAMIRQWEWIKKHQLDNEHHGLFGYISDDGQLLDEGIKANMWKACYHCGRAFMESSRILQSNQIRA